MSVDNQNPDAVVRQALINNAYQYYGQFTKFLLSLPVNQSTPGFQHAILNIDSGMLWIEKMLQTAKLNLAQPEVKKEEPEQVIEFSAVDPSY